MTTVEALPVEAQPVAITEKGELRLRVIQDHAGIEEIRPFWTAWQSHPNANIDFYLTILRSRPEVLRPHILVLYRGDTPEAMLIGRLEHSPLEFKIGYKTLYKAPVHQLTLIVGGRLGNLSFENCEFLLHEIVRSLKQEKIDVVLLNSVRRFTPLYQAVKRLPGLFTRDHLGTSSVHRSTTLPPTMQDFYRGLSPKLRKTLLRQARKLETDFSKNVEIRTFNDAKDLDRMIQDVEQIAQKTYQRGLGVGFVDSPEMIKRLKLEAEKSWLRARILYIAGRPAAFFICDHCGDTFHANYLGYDAEYSKYSPGLYLVTKAIQDFVEESKSHHSAEIDWGPGDARYKEELGTSDWTEASLRIFAPTFEGVCLSALWSSTALADRMARAVLGKAGIARVTKKIWRDRLRKDSTPPSNSR